jgi:hypothetical protein
MNDTIQELEVIKAFYVMEGDWDSANQITLAIDVIENYYFTIKQQNR